MRLFAKATAILLAMVLSACSSENPEDKTEQGTEQHARPTAPSQPNTKETPADMSDDTFKEDNLAFLETNKAKEGVQVTESGLQYKVIESGEGASPSKNDFVTVHYAGRLIDGTEFDSSYKRGEPATFPAGRLIPGWTEALTLMKAGDKWELTIPADIGYGENGAGGVIPGNATLVFDVELLDVQTEEQLLEGMKAPQLEFLAQNAKQDGVTTTESGLQYRVIEAGAGEKSPAATSQVTVHYAGKLIDGSEFDSSYKRGEPASFPLNGVIGGWTEGLQLMKEGDKYEFFIPYELGYGERGSGRNIPPYATLIFTVELISVDS